MCRWYYMRTKVILVCEECFSRNYTTEKNKLNTKLEDPMLKYYFNKLWPDFLLAIEVIEEFKLQTYLKNEKHEEIMVYGKPCACRM